ncbi:MAG: methyltransferase domain-containing protein [Ignavibacteria bacterium]|nr:methyltransferase domain-containing protein [Ignavibacteria bacterium]
MNFLYKAKLQMLLSAMPKGENINYFFQKYISKSLPIPDDELATKINTVKMHLDKYLLYSENKDLSKVSYYEFGSGYDLVIPLTMRQMGISNLTCIDIRELVFPDLINDTIIRLRKHYSESDSENIFDKDIPEITQKNYKDILYKYFNIKYFAPLDARKTGLETDSIDFILSNATFEHIPVNSISDILKECYRILKKGGIMSNAIDYRDHWSFFDNSISVYNYLQYSENEWKKVNPSLMYQNRLRHRDYIEFIKSAGFEIMYEKKDLPENNDLESFKLQNINELYKEKYTIDELTVKSSLLVLKKN